MHSSLLFLALSNGPVPPGGPALLPAVAPLRLAHSYGRFAVTPTTRLEIVVGGYSDGEQGRASEYRDKPGDIIRRLPSAAAHQPRLDWQRWLASLSIFFFKQKTAYEM